MTILGIFCICLMFVIIWLWVAYKKACEYGNDLSGKASRLTGENKRMRDFLFKLKQDNCYSINSISDENDDIDKLTKGYRESFS